MATAISCSVCAPRRLPSDLGDEAWAGLGWCVDETGGGLFVEHHGDSEQSVMELIELSLADMNASRGGGYGPVHMALASAQSTGLPVCAMVVAAYRVSTWHDPAENWPDPSMHSTPDGLNGHRQPMARTGTHTLNGQLLEGSLASEPLGELPLQPVGKTPGRANSQPRITVEKEIDYLTARRYYELYRETFGELATFAVARQLLTEAEFLAEMLDPRVLKYIAWDDKGQAIGMTTLTSDLSTVPWIEPGYFAHHYPDHYARGAIYYLGFTLVHPQHRGAKVFSAMIEHMVEVTLTQEIIFAWDMCLANDDNGFGGGAGRLLQTLTDGTVEAIDRQTYYATKMAVPKQTKSSR